MLEIISLKAAQTQIMPWNVWYYIYTYIRPPRSKTGYDSQHDQLDPYVWDVFNYLWK